jgi:hypothetical protein
MGPRSVPGPTGRPHRPAARPDPTRQRLALSVGGLAAMSALITAIVVPPSAAAPSTNGAAAATTTPTTLTVPRAIQYVQMAPGQSPPPGARVIDAKAPKPITIVTLVPAPAQRTVVVRTTQSGKVLP